MSTRKEPSSQKVSLVLYGEKGLWVKDIAGDWQERQCEHGHENTRRRYVQDRHACLLTFGA